jgi:hypothetical protein
MSAWDLTCRPSPPPPPPPEATHVSSPPSGANRTMGDLVAQLHHPNNFGSIDVPHVGSDLANHQHRFVMGAPFVAPYSSTASMIWENLSPNKQLQALLATATRAATLNTSNYSSDLSPPLEWLKGPKELDLTRSYSVLNFENSIKEQHPHPMTTSVDFHNSSSDHKRPYNQHVGDKHRQNSTASSLSSTSPVSLTGSSAVSSSTEHIDLSMVKAVIPNVNIVDTNMLMDSQRKNSMLSPTQSNSSSLDNSSDADYANTGDASLPNSTLDNKIDRRARKKDQNRRAAHNYRRKKMEERERMLEEEARLVHIHVRLAGKIAHLEKEILLILSTKAAKTFDKNGHILSYACPICRNYARENIQTLRDHLKAQHFQEVDSNNTIKWF